ncbi:hypothetical protein P7K49_035040 [Saguinus oedipus]|uniref:Secreted protein n=1 Tax=Saguinus oedipus TaxID=9490 RepID=A0ABQ9TWE8_SAGOE|nr:hypothetical protein P7K49_035040 [Saguinus oedipus]
MRALAVSAAVSPMFASQEGSPLPSSAMGLCLHVPATLTLTPDRGGGVRLPPPVPLTVTWATEPRVQLREVLGRAGVSLGRGQGSSGVGGCGRGDGRGGEERAGKSCSGLCQP